MSMDANRHEKLKVGYYKSVRCKKVDWLWYPYIPYGKITIVQGDPGEGKSTFALSLSALVSNGGYLPFSGEKIEQGAVVYQNSEDGLEDTICPRLKSLGANLDKVAYIDETNAALAMDDERLEQVLEETGARLMILDPIQAYCGENADMNRASGIRPILSKLAKLAQRKNCAIILIGHLSKATSMKDLYRGLGSIDIPAAARSVLLVSRLKESPNERVVAQIKNNLAPIGDSMVFRVTPQMSVDWVRVSRITAEEIVCDMPDKHISKRDKAESEIYKLLIKGAKPSNVVIEECRKLGISERTVNKVKADLGIRSIKRKDGWYWFISNSEEEEDSDGK